MRVADPALNHDAHGVDFDHAKNATVEGGEVSAIWVRDDALEMNEVLSDGFIGEAFFDRDAMELWLGISSDRYEEIFVVDAEGNGSDEIDEFMFCDELICLQVPDVNI